jgi:hypothetical protein
MRPLVTLLALAIHPLAAPAQPCPTAPPRDDALRQELLRLADEDQKAREGMTAAKLRDTTYLRALLASDSTRIARLRAVVAAHGWPGASLVGRDGAHAAWLVLQHLPDDVQRTMLPRLERAGACEVDPRDVALLTDRVLSHAGKPQRYGSQFHPEGDSLVAEPIEDIAHLDERRAAAGLPPMAEYVRMLAEAYRARVVWPPRTP